MLIYLQMLDTPEEKSKFETLYYTCRRTMPSIGRPSGICGRRVLDVHDGAWGKVYKLGQMLLRPPLSFTLAFDFPAQGVAVQALFMLVHFHITPILFYISGADMKTKYNFIFKVYFSLLFCTPAQFNAVKALSFRFRND